MPVCSYCICDAILIETVVDLVARFVVAGPSKSLQSIMSTLAKIYLFLILSH